MSEYSPRFESVWAIYPNGAGKGAASKAFEALVPDDALTAKIVASIKAQMAWPAWLKDGGAFIPHFSTWLSRRQWEDRAPTPQVSALSAAASDWTCTRSGIEAKGVELGLGRWDQPAFEAGRGGETFQRYEARVRAAAAQREDCPA